MSRFLPYLLFLLFPRAAFVLPTSVVDAVKGRKVIALGDSYTEGLFMSASGDKYLCCHPYSGRLQQLLPASEVIQAGRSGQTAIEIVERIPRHLAMHENAKVFVILAGTNDLDRRVPVNKTVHDIMRLHKLALNSSSSGFADPVVYTVAVTVPQAREGRFPPGEREAINQKIAEFQRACSSRVALLDLDQWYNISDPVHADTYYCKDGLHMTEVGYDRFADIIYDTLQNFTVVADATPFHPSCITVDALEPTMGRT